ncbi:hypothetical protein C2G38_2182722 [Gigaspora rosea]|uniref:Uncharacterized protein n=1 Tax=Gigaspora rosea TaxID=44941 RepID=A0A397VBP1_9GLOM|nr:hypothetical protein C2G38_2182722 [Gigaspora rosea]
MRTKYTCASKLEVSFIVVKFSELFNNKLVSSELYNKVKYLEVYIEELEYLRLENESIYLKLENKATYSRLHDKKDSKSIVEIESDVYDYKIEYSRLEKIKYSREYGDEEDCKTQKLFPTITWTKFPTEENQKVFWTPFLYSACKPKVTLYEIFLIRYLAGVDALVQKILVKIENVFIGEVSCSKTVGITKK